MNIIDAYFKKDITYNYQGRDLTFQVSQSLFSSHDIDLGTKHLLQTLHSEGPNTYEKVLDLGCGVGLIGISLGSACSPAVIHMVDRDALALEFSRQNAKLNGVTGVKIYGSLGYDDVAETNFDLIVSNIPAKVGEMALSYILEDAKFYVRPGGRIAVVVIDAIGDYVTKVLKANKNINIVFYKRWPGYLVFHYQFFPDVSEPKPKLSAFDRGIYSRGRKDISVSGSRAFVETTYGLPEFDTLSFETDLLLNKMSILKNQKIDRAIVLDPGQGFIPVTLSVLSEVGEIDLASRDLQALQISKKNLASNGYPSDRTFLFHEVGMPNINYEQADFIVGILNKEDGFKVHSTLIEEIAKQLSKSGLTMLVSSSTPITRLETYVQGERLLQVLERQKSKGKSLLVMKQRG